MAMIEIYKHNKSLSIPAGAYHSQYAPNGWKLSKDAEVSKLSLETDEDKNIPEQTEDINLSKETVSEDDSDNVEDNVEYVDPEELREKPLEDLDFQELQILAEDMGIDIEGLKSSKSLRNAIKKQEEK